jgi:proteasome component ECM29
MYVTTGIERMPVPERLELLPKLIKNISRTGNDHHQRILFNVFLRLLQHFVPPERASTEDAELRAKLGLQDAPVDAVWLVKWFSKLMLLNLNVFAQDGDKSCPGLSAGDVEFLTMGKKETFTPFSVLADIKLAVLRFVASGAFVDEERYMVALIASTDTNSAVGDPAEDVLKRVMPSVSLEEGEVVKNLYGLLLGRSGVPPAKPTLQTKVIGLLSKSRKAADPSHKAEIEKILDLGLETSYSKLRQGAFSFLIWVSRMADEDLAHALAPGVVEKLRYWLLSDGATSDELKGNAYETLVLLASRCIRIVLEPQLDIIRFLFRQLRDDRGAVAASIEGALGVLLTRLSKENFDPAVKAALEDMLLEVIVEEKRGVGQAVKWAGRLLGFSSVIGRWVGVLAVGMGGTIAEEGEKGGCNLSVVDCIAFNYSFLTIIPHIKTCDVDNCVALHPYYYRLMNPEASLSGAKVVDESMDIDGLEDKFAFPKFSELVSYFFSAQHVLPRSYSTSTNLIDGRLPAKSFAAALALVKRIAIWEAQGTQQVEIKVDEDWDRSVDMIISTDELSRGRVENLLKELLYSDPSIVTTLLGMAWEGMIDAGEGVDGARNVWNDLAVLAPQSVLERYTPQLSAVQKLLKAPKEETRRVAAFAVGLLGSHPTVTDATLGQLLATLVAGITEKRSGSFIAIGFLLSKLKLRGRLNTADSEILKNAVEAIATTVSESRDSVLIETAIEALGELAVFNIIKEDMIDVGEVQKALIEKAKRGDEKAVQTLGYLTLIYPEDSSQTESIIEELTKLSENGGVEMSFVAGEALANAAAGWGSSAVRRGRAIAGEQWALGQRNGVRNLLEQFLKRATEPGGGGKRRTTVVGLLSVFEFCGETLALQEKLGEAQQAFRTFLTDRDGELTFVR